MHAANAVQETETFLFFVTSSLTNRSSFLKKIKERKVMRCMKEVLNEPVGVYCLHHSQHLRLLFPLLQASYHRPQALMSFDLKTALLINVFHRQVVFGGKKKIQEYKSIVKVEYTRYNRDNKNIGNCRQIQGNSCASRE